MAEFGIQLKGPIVVRSPNWLGDAVMSLPAVRNLKSLYFHESITVAAPEKLTALWKACPFVDQVMSLHEPKKIGATVAQLRAGKFRSAILLPNSLRVAAEAFLAGISKRIAYSRHHRRFLLTHALTPPPRNTARLHQGYYYLDLVAALGGSSDATLPKLRKQWVEAGDGRPVVAICPGAEYGPAKRWPVASFVAVAKHFVATRNARIVVLGAPADVGVADEFMDGMPGAENRTGNTTLAEFMMALAGARLVICNDSGAMHLASALARPTIAIFGSTEPLLTGPMSERAVELRHHVPCSPCFLRECPIDFGCMKGITPEMVIHAAEQLI